MDKIALKRQEILEMIENNEITSKEGLKKIVELHNKDNKEEEAVTLYYNSGFERKDVTDFETTKNPSGNILIFSDKENIEDTFRNLVDDEGSQIIVVKLGLSYKELNNHMYQIDLTNNDDYLKLVDSLKSKDLLPSIVIYTWADESFSHNEEKIKTQLNKSMYSVLYTVQSFIKEKIDNNIKLLYLNFYDKQVYNPVYKAVSGLIKTIHNENPKFSCKNIAFPSYFVKDKNLAFLKYIRYEINENRDEIDVFYKDDKRLVKTVNQLDGERKENTENSNIKLKKEGVYIITGGLGGLGIIFAKYLLKEYNSNLILIGRSDLNKDKNDKIQELKKIGGKVRYIQADISQKKDVKNLINSVKSEFKNINGLIHCAGVIKDSFVLNKTKEEVDTVLEPKVYGTILLDEAVKDENLDFFIMFSSVSSVLGSLGQGDYAFGNSFMDNFAYMKNKESKTRFISINWPFWKDGGMQIKQDFSTVSSTLEGFTPLSTDSGIKAFEDALVFNSPQVIVLSGEEESIKNHLNQKEDTSDSKIDKSHNGLAGYENILMEKAEYYLKEVLSKTIKLSTSKIDSTEPLESYGIDSMKIMAMTREIEKSFGELSKTLFFEYQTIGELTEYFVKNHGTELAEKYKDEISYEDSSTNKSKETNKQREETSRKRNHQKKQSRFLTNKDSKTNRSNKTSKNRNSSCRDKDVAIIGLSGRYPMANNMEEFWENLKIGKDCITEIPKDRWNHEKYYDTDRDKLGKSYSKWGGFIDDVDKFDSLFFKISPREAQMLDPQERLFLQTVWQTIEDSGYTKRSLNTSKVGVFVGVMWGQYQMLRTEIDGDIFSPISSYASIANRISYYFNFNGPSIAMDTMCSSSLTAIHLACESILRGESSLAIAGGVNVTIHPNKYILLSQQKFAASDGRCRSFGEGGDGYVPGEGVGAILLKPLSKAIEDGDQIYGVIKGTSVNHGGKTNGYTVPNPKAQADVISEALKESNINPREISYLEAHGTGTSLGDPIEINGLTNAFGKYTEDKEYCSIGSVKSNIGHLESAAGIAGIAKILLQMKYKMLVPSIHSDILNPNIKFKESPFYVQRELREWEQPIIEENNTKKKCPRIAGISSFGAGGANAHIILEEYEEDNLVTKEADIENDELHIIVLSAKNEERLKEYAKHVKEYIEKHKELYIKDIAYTLQVGREAMEERIALGVKNTEELCKKLRKYCEGKGTIEYFYKGNIRDYKNKQDILIDGEEGKEFIRKLTIGKKHNKLAQSWVTGTEIEWELLYDSGIVKKVSLPTYPFAKERHWIREIEDAVTIVDGNTSLQSLHPLIDSNESTLEEQCFRKVLTGKEFYTRDHVIDGNMLLPGVAHLEMARIAGELANKKGKVRKLLNIIWARPVVLSNEGQEVYISLYPDKGVVSYEISMLNNYDNRIIYSQGQISYLDDQITEIEENLLNIDEIKQRSREMIKGEICYDNFSNQGFEYGSSLQTITEMYKGNDEVLSLLELPKERKKEFKEFVLHPSLLDGALQTVVGLSDQVEGTGNYLPYAIDEVTIEGELSERCYVYAKESPSQKEENEYIKQFDIVITDEIGQILINIKRFSVKAIPSKLLENTSINKTIYCSSEWKKFDISDSTIENSDIADSEDDKIMIFDNEESNYLEIIGKVKGKNVILVKQGKKYGKIKDFVYEINPNSQDDYIELINSLKEENIIPNKIIHMWSKGKKGENIDKYLENGVYSIFFLTRAIMNHKLMGKIHLNYVYEANPAYEGVSGFIKTITQENPNFICKTVQLEQTGKDKIEKEMLDKILLETQFANLENEEMEIKYKGGNRYIKKLKEVDKEKDTVNQLPLKENGVYIITGGTGGLGNIFAKYLANKVKGKLVLTGRSELNEEKEKKIEELKRLGSAVIYIRADITERIEVEEMIATAKAKFQRIDGIIHSAGLIKDSLIMNKTKEDFDKVIKPKVYGTLWLEEGIKDENLDFFVLFSSTTAITGNPGQCDYAYGNSFMDSFARLAGNKDRLGKTLSINWPLWKDGGMKPDEKTIEFMRKTMGLEPLSTQSGIKAFEDGLKTDYQQMIVVEGQESKMKQIFNTKESTDVLEDKKSIELDKEYESKLEEKTKEYLKSVLGDEIQISPQKIGTEEALESYGIDSVMTMNLTRALEEDFDKLSKTLFYEYQTIEELTKYFLENHQQELIDKFGEDNKKTQKRTLKPQQSKSQEIKEKELTSLSKNRFFNMNQVANQVDNNLDDIAVIGLSGRYPMAKDMEEYWENLKVGKDCITEIPKDRWNHEEYYDPDKSKVGKTYSKWGGFIDDVDKFDPLFFNISPREAQMLDPQERLFLQTVWQTVEDAGYTRKTLSKLEVGVFVGVMYGHYQLFGVEDSQNGNILGLSSSFASIANRISYYFNFQGPSIAMDTMCSSSLTAIHLACESIRRGESNVAIAGGVNVTIHPSKYILISQQNFASSDGRCRSFGEGGDGYVPGEGVGAVLLKPLKKAIEDGDNIYGVIKGTALNHGGKTNGYTVPNPQAQAKVISKALKKSNVNPRTVSYLEAHGTGTSLGDPIEITGLTKSFGEYTKDKQYCSIGSVKSNIGHLESAAGIAGLAKILLQLKYKKLVPSIHSDVINSNIDFNESPFYIQRELQDWEKPIIEENGAKKTYPRIAGLSSFGAGGANAHIIFEEYEEDTINKKQDNVNNEESQIIVLSAKNKERLKEYAKDLEKYIEKHKELNTREIAYTLQIGREAMEERIALVVKDKEELSNKLRQYCEGKREIDYLYKGNIKEYTSSQEILIDGEEGKEFIRKLISSKKYNKLSQLWIVGTEIEWQLLYDSNTKRVSLPVYPFAKERYWIPEVKNSISKGEAMDYVSKIHPLVHSNTSTLKEQKFTTNLTKEDFCLRDHVVNGQMILPGAAYLEMACVAGELAIESKVMSIKETKWLNPISIQSDVIEVNISFFPNGDDIDYEVSSLGKGKTRIIHGQGRISMSNRDFNELEQNYIDIDEIKQRCTMNISGEEYYEKFAESGFNYGESFKSIKELFIADDEVLSCVELPEILKKRFRDYTLHPTLIDGALQSVAGLTSKETDQGNMYLPYGIGEIEIIQDLTEKCYMHVTPLKIQSSSRSDTREFNIEILNEQGEILVYIKNFILKALNQGTFDLMKDQKTHIKEDIPLDEENDKKLLDILEKIERENMKAHEAEKLLENI